MNNAKFLLDMAFDSVAKTIQADEEKDQITLKKVEKLKIRLKCLEKKKAEGTISEEDFQSEIQVIDSHLTDLIEEDLRTFPNEYITVWKCTKPHDDVVDMNIQGPIIEDYCPKRSQTCSSIY